MLNLKQVYSNKKGFTLVEMVLYIAIVSILLTSIYSVIFFTIKANANSESLDMALFNGRFAIEYIKSEVLNADKIICSSKFDNLDKDYPNNIGFVTLEEQTSYDLEGEITDINYNFRTYFIKDDKLIRIAYNTSNASLYNSELLSGHNQICEGIIEFNNCNLDKESNLINISLSIEQGAKPLLLETAINIRCDIE